MMNVSEYASDVGKKVEEILKLCQKLNIEVSNEEDMLSDDDIIMLDNEIASLDEEESLEDLEEQAEDFTDSYEEELEEVQTISKPKKKDKNTQPKKDNKKVEFKEKRKEMYKHKEKLQDNTASNSEDIIAYKENMTVAELSSSLSVSPAALIKKLMGLGIMANINASLSIISNSSKFVSSSVLSFFRVLL